MPLNTSMNIYQENKIGRGERKTFSKFFFSQCSTGELQEDTLDVLKSYQSNTDDTVNFYYRRMITTKP